MGRPVISSWSLAKAMALPAKETDPTSTPKRISTIL